MYKVYALAESLQNQRHLFQLNVLLVDSNEKTEFENCRFFRLADIEQDESATDIINKYRNDKDKLRWSLKPVMMKHLLLQNGMDRLVYLDNDLFFYSDYQFLFNLLNEHSFLLTPHYYKSDPKNNQNWLEANFRLGLYNAGFVGANKKAINTLQWWAGCCLYRCEKNSMRGLFDDQKYLDIIPIIENSACIVRHKGCNVAGWNTEICQREIADHQVVISGKYPIVFVHYNENTIREIINGSDSILFNYYREYVETLKNYKYDLRKKDIYFTRRISDILKLWLWKRITDMKI